MSQYTWLLDNGHGGMVDGKYTTAPNKMYVHPWGPLYEGVFNRNVVNALAVMLSDANIDYNVLVPEDEDVSLKTRVRRANDLYKDDKSCIFVSIHGNAFNGNAHGFEIFTSVGQTRSDDIAEIFAEQVEKEFPNRTMRWDLTDGDKDKEANFYVLKNTNMPAILTENFFFDNEEDALLMNSPEGVERIAKAHFEAIKQIETDGKTY